jgi:hypothetical protein
VVTHLEGVTQLGVCVCGGEQGVGQVHQATAYYVRCLILRLSISDHNHLTRQAPVVVSKHVTVVLFALVLALLLLLVVCAQGCCV